MQCGAAYLLPARSPLPAAMGSATSQAGRRWLQVFETAKATGSKAATHSGESGLQHPGNASESTALMAQVTEPYSCRC